ncbi:MAG: ATP-binding protein [Methanosarcinales archaeon]
MEFFDRKKEIAEIMSILESDPTLITFIYGSINSGKTEMINHLIRNLPEDYLPFYINLRWRFISNYRDFVHLLFNAKESKVKDLIPEILSQGIKILTGFPVSKELFEELLKNKENVFEYLMNLFEKVVNKNKNPILIIDELQKIGDIKIDGNLIYELFNFFIGLTKERHLAHVFAITSDSLFIERVYSEAMLQGRARYVLVDDFDYNTTLNFLDKYGFTEKEKEVAWHYCGGKPVCLLELIRSMDKKKKAIEMLKDRKAQILHLLNKISLFGEKIELEGKVIEVKEEEILEALRQFLDKDYRTYRKLSLEELYLVKKNILFIDPREGLLRPQSKLDLLAIREILIG